MHCTISNQLLVPPVYWIYKQIFINIWICRIYFRRNRIIKIKNSIWREDEIRMGRLKIIQISWKIFGMLDKSLFNDLTLYSRVPSLKTELVTIIQLRVWHTFMVMSFIDAVFKSSRLNSSILERSSIVLRRFNGLGCNIATSPCAIITIIVL